MKTAKIAAIATVVATAIAANLPTLTSAAPARRQPWTITQPDGTTVTLVLQGDEWHHWTSDLDGNLMIKDETGCYHRATPQQQAEWEAEAAEKMQLRASVNNQRCNGNRRNGEAPDSIANASDSINGLDCHFSFPTKGRIHGLIVLVEYQDVKFQRNLYGDPHEQYQDRMMKPGYNYSYNASHVHYGSAHDYFYQNSFELFDPQFDVYGPLLLKEKQAYYGSNSDRKAYEMITEACQQLEDSLGVDFSLYDANNDDVIDFVFAIYAGKGENESGVTTSAVWPHAWNISSSAGGQRFFYGGKRLESYACTCEMYKTHLDGIGTFCHEFSHVLGLRDLYNTKTSDILGTPYNYSVMDNGCYRQNGYHPVGYSAYERYELGWLSPHVLCEATTDTLTDLGMTNQAALVMVGDAPSSGDPRDGEYYLFENRQNVGWDKYLTGHGMLVWHIDYTPKLWTDNNVNNWPNHMCVDLVEARGIQINQDGSEPFPGTEGITSFTDDTTPAFRGWAQPGTNDRALTVRLEKPITNICELITEQEDYPIITFDFMGGKPSNGSEIGSINEIEQDATQSAPGLILLDGRLILKTATGCHDAWGRTATL